LTKFEPVSSHGVVLIRENIDTDQIIPARFLKVTSRDGLGRNAFADWRSDPSFPLNHVSAESSRVLIAGHNFGCGSSREHAVWALMDFGFRVVISTGFADIFKQNALKNGLLPVVLGSPDYGRLVTAIQNKPSTRCEVRLLEQTVFVEGVGLFAFEIDSFSKFCLLQGTDELGYLLNHLSAIETFEKHYSEAAS